MTLSALIVAAFLQAPDEPTVVRVTPMERLYAAGRPARVGIAIENHRTASLSIPNAVLFGAGVRITTLAADGSAIDRSSKFAPAAAQQPLLLPAGGSISVVVDLQPLFPDLFEARGMVPVKLTVNLEVAGVAAAPLDLELHPDWRGWHAVIATDLGEMELELFAEQAPLTVANFLELADAGFYDGLSLHRVVKGFMVQGGCPNGDGTGDGPRQLPLEAGRGEGAVKHERGTIAMAHRADPNSGSCQFFVCHRDQPALNGNYAAFGKVVRGLEVLDAIADVPCALVPGGPDSGPSRPKQQVTIQSVRPLATAKRGG